MAASEEAATKVKDFINAEATEPITLSQMVAMGVCQPLASKEENISLEKLLELERTIVHRDIPVSEDKKERLRVYWREEDDPRKIRSKSEKKAPMRMLNCSIQPPSLKSRRPFVSPAKTKKAVNGEEQVSLHLSNSAIGRKKQFISPLSKTNHRLDRVQNEETLSEEVQELKRTVEGLNGEIEQLSEEYSERELQQHIDMLHEYNEVKDMGQSLMGKLAEVEGTTTTSLYQRFGLELDS